MTLTRREYNVTSLKVIRDVTQAGIYYNNSDYAPAGDNLIEAGKKLIKLGKAIQKK